MHLARAGVAPLVVVVAVGALVFMASQALAVTPSIVRVDSGLVSKFRWKVDAYRGGASSQPCLRIDFRRVRHRNPAEIQLGETSCRAVQPLPNIFGVVDELDHPNVTVIAMAFPPKAVSITLSFAGKKKDKVLPLKLLSAHQAQKTKLLSFRYGAIAFKGNSCLDRFVTHGQNGAILDDGGKMHCQS